VHTELKYPLSRAVRDDFRPSLLDARPLFLARERRLESLSTEEESDHSEPQTFWGGGSHSLRHWAVTKPGSG